VPARKKAPRKPRRALTSKVDMDAFCFHYLRTFNHTEAYQIAGGMAQSAGQAADKYLQRPEVQERLGQMAVALVEQLEKNDQMIVASIKSELYNIMTTHMGDLVEKVGQKQVKFRPWGQLTTAQKSIIQELAPTKYGVKMRVYSRIEAMKVLVQIYDLVSRARTELPVVEMNFSRTYQGDQENAIEA